MGSKVRLPLTPLTNRYFVFISSSLREKSAVLFETIPTHVRAREVFEEFASICTVGLQCLELKDNVGLILD